MTYYALNLNTISEDGNDACLMFDLSVLNRNRNRSLMSALSWLRFRNILDVELSVRQKRTLQG